MNQWMDQLLTGGMRGRVPHGEKMNAFLWSRLVFCVLCSGLAVSAFTSCAGDSAQLYSDSLSAPNSAEINPAEWQAQDARTCGRVSYDPQGGSIVINDRIKLQAQTRDVESALITEVSQGPAHFCLYGSWVRPSQVFSFYDFD